MHTDLSGDCDLDLIVAEREVAADGVVVLGLRDPVGRDLPLWQPGAHVDLVLADGLVRQYSLCGDPAARSRYRVAVLREPDGRGGSAYVHDRLHPGVAVHVQGPRNHFPLVPAGRYLFIGGGIGITPLIPMIAQAEASSADWHLVYGGRSRSSMAFRDHLQGFHPGRITISPQDETGLLNLDSLLREPAEELHVYCCGPEPLLAAVESRCSDWHTGSLHVERFAPKALAAPARDAAFEVELTLSGRVVTVPVDRSILQVVEEAGVAVLSSCGEGTCGTCEVPILAGRADHRDSLLTKDEQLANQTLMICVSRALSPRLVLEL